MTRTLLLIVVSLTAAVIAQGGQTWHVTVFLRRSITPTAHSTHGPSSISTNLCPALAPCCSPFGFCGDGTFCLGGCNPLASHSLNSCVPNPICRSANYTFTDQTRIYPNASLFDGNLAALDLNQGDISNTNSSGELVLMLTRNNGGTRISSTRYVHYGKITATMKTGRWNGVVTAFITMSNIKDEIDWEFPGANTTTGQTNFYWQGNIPAETQSVVENGISDTYSHYHSFSIDWQPNNLTFLLDNKVVRTVNKADTIDADGVAHYPTTPSSIQISLWPAGVNTSSPGTIDWAGGMINWQDPDYQSTGHFYALLKSVDVQCADPTPPDPKDTSYVYGANSSAMTPSVTFSNQSVLINGAPTCSASFGMTWSLVGALSLLLVGLL
ncbi:glycoside hydrolase family 16 protein [Lactarius hengduanensis]|nr:glycoside hydrolase family 16 protein [Lactarius hengduanensis]